MNRASFNSCVLWLALSATVLGGDHAVPAEVQVLDASLHHLRSGTRANGAIFPSKLPASAWPSRFRPTKTRRCKRSRCGSATSSGAGR